MQLLRKHHIDPRNVVSLTVDVEGFDDLLLLSLDLSDPLGLRPSVIFFEWVHWYRQGARLNRRLRHLVRAGYIVSKIGYDMAAVRMLR
jgi:hypothetical protein